MALSLNSLTNYIDQLSQPLMHRALLQSVTNKFVNIIPGVFQSVSLNLIDENSPFTIQADTYANIGFNDSGTTTLSQVNISVCALKFQQQYPIYAQGTNGLGGIEQTYLMYLYNAEKLSGSYHDTIPTFEEVWTDMLIKYINQGVDQAEWIGGYNPSTLSGSPWSASTFHSGDTAGNASTSFLSTCTGFLNEIVNSSQSASCVFVASQGLPTSSNLVAIVNAMVAAIPTDILGEDLIIFTSPQTVMNYKQAILAANGFHYYVSDAKSVLNGGDGSAATNTLTQDVPGFNITMVGTVGLKGNNGLYMSYAKNFNFATALEGDFATIKSWYSMDFDVFRCMSRWRQGTGIAWPQYVIAY